MNIGFIVMDHTSCKDIVDASIEEYLNSLTYDQRLIENTRYVLEGGKRLRSALTIAILEKLLPGQWYDLKQACLIPELIHCSSLIVDDLPAFDNAETRRGKRCVHLKSGEGLAYLLSFNLITEAFLIMNNQLPRLKLVYSEKEAYQQYELQLKNVIENISGHRALEGQLLSTFHTSGMVNLKDLYSDPPPKLKLEEIRNIILKKTSSFFEIALVTGWIVGCGDLNKIDAVKELADNLGLCYQIYDDFVDYEEDISNEHFSHNYIYHRGAETAYQEYTECATQLRNKIQELDLECPMFTYVCDYMTEKINEILEN